MNRFHYAGKELDIFAYARNWKRYWSSHVGQLIAGDVLEVGAGIGANTAVIRASAGPVRSWTALEPDPELARRLEETLSAHPATAAMVASSMSGRANGRYGSCRVAGAEGSPTFMFVRRYGRSPGNSAFFFSRWGSSAQV